MEHLYFSPTAASGIFHGEVHKTFGGLASVTNIHDNIFVYAKDYPNHYDHLKVMLERCVVLDIQHKPSRSTIGLTCIKWFGREFYSNGVTTDQEKISKIKNDGRPSTAGEIRSLWWHVNLMPNSPLTTRQTSPMKMQLPHCECYSKRNKSSNGKRRKCLSISDAHTRRRSKHLNPISLIGTYMCFRGCIWTWYTRQHLPRERSSTVWWKKHLGTYWSCEQSSDSTRAKIQLHRDKKSCSFLESKQLGYYVQSV